MAESRTTAQEVQAEILDAVRKGQEAVVDAIKHVSETIHSIAPSIPVRHLPHAGKLPKPEELSARASGFAGHLLATGRSLAESLIQATKPPASGQTKPPASDQNGTTPPEGGPAAR